MTTDALTIWTIGHSNRSFDVFCDLLDAQSIDTVVDVRRHPGSRTHPQFGTDEFAARLADVDIGYVHELDLGGRRRLTSPVDPNVSGGWRNPSFQAYAQYTRSGEFTRALTRVRERARTSRIALCCSEAVPWRCHRWIISDVLTAKGDHVRHILSPGQVRTHHVSGFACIHRDGVAWPAPSELVDAQLQQASLTSR